MLASHARRAHVLCNANGAGRAVAVNGSRRNAARHGPGDERWDEGRATRLGALPRSSAGTDPSRGVGRWSYTGAALLLACEPVIDGPPGLPRIVARLVDAKRGPTTGREKYGLSRRFPQPTTSACELRAQVHRARSPPTWCRFYLLTRRMVPAPPGGARCAQPILVAGCASSRRVTVATRRASSTIRAKASWYSSASGSS